MNTTILITTTVRYRGGRTIERGTVLAARSEGGYPYGPRTWAVAHPSGMEGCFAHIPAGHATEVAA